MSKRQKVFRLLAWVAALAVAIVSVLPGSHRPHLVATNVIEHFLAYFVMTAIFAVAYLERVHGAVLFVGLVVYGGLLEIAQLWIPGRAAKGWDVVANSLGVLTAIVCAELLRRTRARPTK